MSDEFGGAVWIGGAHPFDLHEVYFDFRSPRVKGGVGDVVELLISADARYKLWLNGQFVARGPARSYPHSQSFDRLDLSAAWQKGDNLLAVQVYQPGYSHFSYVHRAVSGLLAALLVNGSQQLVSDASWHVRRNRSFASQVPRVSIYGSGVEIRNMELDDVWQRVGFVEKGWQAARVIASADGHIWHGLRERDTPMLVEREAEMQLIECRLGEDDFMFEEAHWSLCEAWMGGSSAEFSSTNGWFQPHLTFDTTALFLFDLGRAYTCQGWAEIRGASGGEVVNISYADKMVNGELVISDPQTYCRVRMTDSFALRKGNQIVEPFAMRGGRYVLFQISGEVGKNFKLRPHLRVAEYPLTITKPFTSNDLQLAAIAAMCENTLLACLQDSFVDCVWRESSQWLGDGLIQSKIMAAMCADFRPMRKLLRDTAAGQDQYGMLPSVAPAEVHAYTIPRYGLMWLELLNFYFAATGDAEFVRELWPTLTRQLGLYKALNVGQEFGK